MKVAGACPDPDVEVDEPARRNVEQRHIALQHPGVEDHARIGTALVGCEEVHDRVATGLLLAVAADAQVDRQPARLQLLGGLELHVELPLVVGDPAPIQTPVPNGRLEWIGFPELERRRRLDVEVSVADHRRALAVPRRRGDLAERQRMPLPVDELCVAAGAAHEVAHPLAGLPHVFHAFGVRADARDADELGELFEPGLIHGAGVYGRGCGGRDPGDRLSRFRPQL